MALRWRVAILPYRASRAGATRFSSPSPVMKRCLLLDRPDGLLIRIQRQSLEPKGRTPGREQ